VEVLEQIHIRAALLAGQFDVGVVHLAHELVEEAVHVAGAARDLHRLEGRLLQQLLVFRVLQFGQRVGHQLVDRYLLVVPLDRFEQQFRDFVCFFIYVDLFSVGQLHIHLFVHLEVSFCKPEIISAFEVFSLDVVVEELVVEVPAVAVITFTHQKVSQIVSRQTGELGAVVQAESVGDGRARSDSGPDLENDPLVCAPGDQ